MDTRIITPQDLIKSLLESPDFGTVADIARASGWNYQRLHRWSKGDVGDIPQDDMADLLAVLELDPADYGVRPSLVWRRANERPSNQVEAPEWFKQFQDQQASFQAEILRRLTIMERKLK